MGCYDTHRNKIINIFEHRSESVFSDVMDAKVDRAFRLDLDRIDLPPQDQNSEAPQTITSDSSGQELRATEIIIDPAIAFNFRDLSSKISIST